MKKITLLILMMLVIPAFVAAQPLIPIEEGGKAVDPRFYNKETIEKKIKEPVQSLLDLFKGEDAEGQPNATPVPPSGTTPPPAPTGAPTTPGGNPINQSFVALTNLKQYVSQKTGVPLCVLEAISWIEYPTAWKYTPETIQRSTQPGQVIPNCPWNLCSASGHMQMTIGVDERGDTKCTRCGVGFCPNAWAQYGNAVQKLDGATHKPNVCNLRDSEFGAALKLKSDSKTAPGDMNWDWNAMYKAGRSYYGNCSYTYDFNTRGYPTRVPVKLTYCEFMQYHCSL